jgi:DNA-binding CsgD family transcriptional regulator
VRLALRRKGTHAHDPRTCRVIARRDRHAERNSPRGTVGDECRGSTRREFPHGRNFARRTLVVQFDGVLSREAKDKLVPLTLAKELSFAGRVEQAQSLFALYKRQSGNTSPLLVVTGNPTRYAFELLVEGFVAESADERPRARRAYLDAFTRFRAVDYKRRAVHSALRLGALLNEAELFEYADATTRHLPARSWLRQQVANLPTDIIVRGLSAARREVLQLLCRGFTVSEIAAHRQRSRKTIANTVTEVYRAFNVRNRTELLNELLRRGIIKSA